MTWQVRAVDRGGRRWLVDDTVGAAVADWPTRTLTLVSVPAASVLARGYWHEPTDENVEQFRELLPRFQIVNQRDDALTAAFDPDQPRDEHGKWAPTGSSSSRSDEPLKVATTERVARDMMVDAYGRNFLRALPEDYKRTVDEVVERRRVEGNHVHIPYAPDNPDGTTNRAAAIYRAARAGTSFSKYEDNLVKAFVDGDKRALGAIRAQATKVVREYGVEEARPEAVASIAQAVRDFDALPAAQSLREKYGSPTVMVATRTPGRKADDLDIPSGQYSPAEHRIVMFENAFERAGSSYGAGFGELRPGSPTVGGSGGGQNSRSTVFTHEFGHHVHDGVTSEQYQEWNRLASDRINVYNEELRNDPDNATPTISYYAMNSGRGERGNLQESFAETFATVMHPDYDRSMYHESNHGMLTWMEQLVEDA